MGFFHGILPIHRFAANFAVLSCRQQRANAPADYLMIIRDQNPQCALPLLSNACKSFPNSFYPTKCSCAGTVSRKHEKASWR